MNTTIATVYINNATFLDDSDQLEFYLTNLELDNYDGKQSLYMTAECKTIETFSNTLSALIDLNSVPTRVAVDVYNNDPKLIPGTWFLSAVRTSVKMSEESANHIIITFTDQDPSIKAEVAEDTTQY